MISQTQISHGATLQQILQKRYPGINIIVDRLGSGTMIFFYKKLEDGKSAVISLEVTDAVLLTGTDVLEAAIEDTVKKLNKFTEKANMKDNNPSSREFR